MWLLQCDFSLKEETWWENAAYQCFLLFQKCSEWCLSLATWDLQTMWDLQTSSPPPPEGLDLSLITGCLE